MTVRTWPVTGLLLAVLWLAVRGVELTPRVIVGEFLIGVAVGLPIAYGFRRMYEPTTDVGRALRVTPVVVQFFIVFLREIVSSGIDMTYRVLHPTRPIEPDVIELPLRVRSDAGITSIANTISLTPGTLTMDHDPDTNSLYIHAVAGQRRETTVAPIRRWEDLLLLILDEEFDPEDEPPSRPYQRAPAARRGGSTSDSGGDGDGS